MMKEFLSAPAIDRDQSLRYLDPVGNHHCIPNQLFPSKFTAIGFIKIDTDETLPSIGGQYNVQRMKIIFDHSDPFENYIDYSLLAATNYIQDGEILATDLMGVLLVINNGRKKIDENPGLKKVLKQTWKEVNNKSLFEQTQHS